jgi:hypothetical protein
VQSHKGKSNRLLAGSYPFAHFGTKFAFGLATGGKSNRTAITEYLYVQEQICADYEAGSQRL